MPELRFRYRLEKILDLKLEREREALAKLTFLLTGRGSRVDIEAQQAACDRAAFERQAYEKHKVFTYAQWLVQMVQR